MRMSAMKIRFFALLLGIALTVIVGIAAVRVYACEGRQSLPDVGTGAPVAELPGGRGGQEREESESGKGMECPSVQDGTDAGTESWTGGSGRHGRFGNVPEESNLGCGETGSGRDHGATRRGGRRNGSGPFGRFQGRGAPDGTVPMDQRDELIEPEGFGSGDGSETGMNGRLCPPMGPRTRGPRGESQERRPSEVPADPDGGVDTEEISL